MSNQLSHQVSINTTALQEIISKSRKISELPPLQNVDGTELVAVETGGVTYNLPISLIASLASGLEVFEGTGLPSQTPPANFKTGDFYIRVIPPSTNVLGMWQYNGQEWIDTGVIHQGIETKNTPDIELSGDGTGGNPIEAELTQGLKDEIAKGVEAHDYTLDDVVQNGNETTESIILSSEEHPSESVEIGVKELAPGVAFGVIEFFSENNYCILFANGLAFSLDGKRATFSASGLNSSFSDGKSLSINFPTDNPIPLQPNISTWFVLSVNGVYANNKGEIRLPENQQLKITANATVLADWNRHTVFLDGTNLEILVNVSTNELDENTEIYFYNMSDSEVDFKFTVVSGWSLPDDATLEPNGTCILMRVLDEQKLILIGNE